MSDGRCCIADLGLAVLQRAPQPGVLPPSSHNLSGAADELRFAAANLKVGTRRCMAPEVLDETINVAAFDSYRQADVYSFSLVVWEIARRFVVSGAASKTESSSSSSLVVVRSSALPRRPNVDGYVYSANILLWLNVKIIIQPNLRLRPFSVILYGFGRR